MRRVIIIAPKTAIKVWEFQIRQHLAIPYTFDGDGDGVHFRLVGFGKSWRKATMKTLIEWQPEVVIVDESHRIKSRQSRQSKAAWHIGKCARYRLALTGTPTDGDDLQLWSQFRFIDSRLLGDDWRTFEQRWTRRSGFGGYKRKLKKHLKKKYYQRLASRIFRMTREEAYEVPDEIDLVIPFELTGKAKRIYRQLEDEMMAEIGDEEIITPMRITQMLRLAQVAGGFFQNDNVTIALEQDKLAALLDYLEDTPKDEKIVIFAQFTSEIDALRAAIGRTRTVAVLDGRTKDRGVWKDFQDKRNPSVLICQTATGSESIECTAASLFIFYSLGHSWLQYDQARSRGLGPAQKKKVAFLYMIAQNTIDEDKLVNVRKKGRNAADILRELRRRRVMAKAAKEAAPKKGVEKKTAKKKPAPPRVEAPEFGLQALAKAMGLEEATVRQKLRAAGVEKTGRFYDFKNKTGVEAMAKKLGAKKAA